jgi:outer membrane protein OmpA-like peptidoglycan-associated protein
MPKTDRATLWGLRAVSSALALACFMLAPVAVRAQDADVDPACVAAGIVDASACADFLAANAAPPADEPVVEEPVPDEPVVEQPAVEEPVVPDEPVVDEPVVDEPVPDEPVVEQPAVDEPVVPDEPAVEDHAPVDTTSDLDPACAAVGITDADACASFLTGGDQPVPEEPSVEPPADEPVVTDTMSEAPVVKDVPADESAVDSVPSEEPVVEDGAPSEDPAVSDEPSAEPVADPAVEDDSAFTGDDAPTDAAFASETPIATDDQGQQVEPIADLPPDTDPADVAPVTDSGKVGEDAGEPPQPPEFVPVDDAQAQTFDVPPETDPVADEEATQIDTAPSFEAPQGVTIIDQSTNVYEVNNQIIINNFAEDRDRLAYDSSRVDYYSYPNSSSSETIYREDGSQLITIYDRFGNIISRTVYDADGNGYDLAYYDPSYEEDERMYWGDPGDDLPPLKIEVSLNLYIFVYDRYDLADLTRFLFLPPVEPIRHLYTIDEVKRSPRLRDAVPRVEIGELSFASGSAEVTPQQVPKLKKLASAILAVLKKNRGETFLIEGHTDAVGSDRDNLVLSDARARTVARVLTRSFHVPPENLVTQGYGERFLKVKTAGPSAANRRVAVRRITALITPTR